MCHLQALKRRDYILLLPADLAAVEARRPADECHALHHLLEFTIQGILRRRRLPGAGAQGDGGKRRDKESSNSNHRILLTQAVSRTYQCYLISSFTVF